ncbi:MAG TPA: NYN domain-containing protein [Nocardioidaceae bacterium]|nr:NYN domain-containing protein [Nocardioidaceae bacterium]
MSAADPLEPAGEVVLPAAVRNRVVAIAAEALGRLPAAQVPPPLRRAATFAPARRAKLAGGQIAGLVETDDDFREHLATQVRALVPEAVAALEAGEQPSGPAERTEAAAVAWLARTPGWAAVVADAAASSEGSPERGHSEHARAALDKATAELASERQAAKETRAKLRGQIDELKRENSRLRRVLGQARGDLKAAQSELADSAALLARARQHADSAARAADAKLRRLETRVAELESEATGARRRARVSRDAEVVRLRLLLDTLADAVSGLRQELALPLAHGLPAESVPALEPGGPAAVRSVGRARSTDDPALLRELLDLPKVHLVVDGYNVSKTAWPTAPLDQQRTRLVSKVAGLVAGKGVEVTIAFDGAELDAPPAVRSPRGVRVRFSPPGVTADDLIRQLVAAEPQGRPVVVVSTDREVAESVRAMGARAVDSLALARAIGS